MKTGTVIAEAHGLEEAREQARGHLPHGLDLLSERVDLEGQVRHHRAAGETVEAALTEAEQAVPAGAKIIQRRRLLAPELKQMLIEARDDQAARARVQSRLKAAQELLALEVVKPAERGVLGLGSRAGLYRATIQQLAVVEVVFQTRSRFAFDYGPRAVYRSLGVWGRFGMEAGQFYAPVDLAVDLDGAVFVTDNGLTLGQDGQFNQRFSRVSQFDGDGTLVAHWGTYGPGEDQFLEVQGIAAGASGTLYVADGRSARLSRCDRQGRVLARWGSLGKGDGQFSGGTLHVAVTADGAVYVSDRSGHRVLRFDSEGRHQGQWGGNGVGEGKFEGPEGIAVDSQGNVYVVDGGNERVQKFDAQGKFLRLWGGRGRGDGEFSAPRGIAVDTAGCVYVCGADDRVQKFSSEGQFIGTWGHLGKNPGQLNLPQAVAVDPAGQVYVLEYTNRRVQRFG